MRVHTGEFLIAIIAVSVIIVMTAAVFDTSADDGEKTVYVEETGEHYSTLKEAVNNAVDRGNKKATIKLTAEQEYIMDFDLRGCNLSITGQGYGTVVLKEQESYSYNVVDTIVFRNLTLCTNGNNYCGYQALIGEYYYHVQIKNLLCTYGTTSVFEDCTFISN